MGLPHEKRHAAMVRQAATDLREDVKSLSSKLSKYQEKDDPLVALMLDVFNDREVASPYNKKHQNDNGPS
jgi:hypothetical protein